MNEDFVTYEQAVKLNLRKVCRKCGRELPITAFHKLKSGKYGVNGRCKECRSTIKQVTIPDLCNEIWKDVVGYEGLYQVSNLGRVKSIRGRKVTEKIMKPHLQRTGYYSIWLCKEDKKGNKSLHRIIAEAFIPNPENKPCIDHVNGVATDNRIENLRWCTYKENSNNPVSIQKMINTRNSDEYRRLQKSIQPSKKVDMLTLDGEYIKSFISISDAARELNGNIAAIHRCCNDKQKYAYGYKWRYNEE